MSETLERSQTDINLLEGLEAPTRKLMDQHLAKSKPWYPHAAIPEHHYDPSVEWSPDIYPLSEGVRSALLVNTETEDNLPYYTLNLSKLPTPGHPLEEWNHRWTAEEGRHSIVMRGWIHATGALDPVLLEDDRMRQVTKAEVPVATDIPNTIAYVSFQELATNIAHRNTGRKLGNERGGNKVMGLVAGDEKKHHEFYSGLVVAALEIEPSAMLMAIAQQMSGFEMPGTGIKDFKQHKELISREGIFSRRTVLFDVFLPTLEGWKKAIQKATNLTDEAERVREKILSDTERLTLRKARRTYQQAPSS